MKKISMILLSGFLLSACGNEEIKEEPDDEEVTEVDDTETEEPEDEDTEIVEDAEAHSSDVEDNEMEKSGDLQYLGDLMAENSFVNDFGVEALENYLEIDDQLTYINYDEESGFLNEGGSSKEEVIAAVDSVIEDSVYEIVEDEDQDITSIVFYYMDPDEPEQEGEDAQVMNYGDVSFVFKDDNLYLSSVAPGWYELDMEDLADAEEVTEVTSTEELSDLIDDPQYFTLGKINLNNEELVQVMVPSSFDSEEENDLLAMYLYFVDSEIVFANYIPFMEAASNFPVNGILAINEFLQEAYPVD